MISRSLEFDKVVDCVLEEVHPPLPIRVRLQHAIKLHAPIHLVSVLEAPVTAYVPLLRKIAWPVLKICAPRLKKLGDKVGLPETSCGGM